MAKDVEVIVVGAGPAGAAITLELAKRKFRVLCIEREFEVGYPNKSTAATPLETFEVFELPEKLGFGGICGFRMFGPSTSYTGETDQVIGRVLRFREVKQYLFREAIRLGAQTMLGTEVTGAIREGEKVVGVSYRGHEGKGEVRANVVVDCTGPAATLAVELGLWKKRPQELGVALEYFLEGAKPDAGNMGFFLDFYIGNTVAPGGYAWIFGTAKDQVKAGICKLHPPFTAPNEKSQRDYFYDLWRTNSQIQGAFPFEIHRCAHYVTGGVWDCARDGFLAIGDAVNKVNPIFGEGVRPSFWSARFGADAIEEARKTGDFTKKRLSLFDTLWEKKWGTYLRFSKIFFQLLYTTHDKTLDDLVRALQKLDVEVWLRLYLGTATREDYMAFFSVAPQVLDRTVISAFLKSVVG